ncbi:MAG: type II 3-dehydroquinate dehydratase [Lachnospira sp.]
MKILVINGPNINFLGIREKGIYGEADYNTLVSMINRKAEELKVSVEVFQSNHEGAIIDKIQQAYYDNVDGIVINPGAFTHYSYAVRDALASVSSIPKIEVHISNVHTREEFRHVSVTAPVCTGQVVGLGLNGYLYAMQALADSFQMK